MKNLIWLSAYLIISAIFSSCSKDDENTSIIPEGEKTNVNVSLNIAPINAMGTNINDNRTSIENFWLLEFDQQGKNVAVIKELRFSINSAETVELVAGANMKLVVIANVDKSIVFQLGKQTYEALKNTIYTLPVNSSNAIPLVGEQVVSITKENQTLDAITLERIAAEVKFTINNTSSDFSSKSRIRDWRLRVAHRAAAVSTWAYSNSPAACGRPTAWTRSSGPIFSGTRRCSCRPA